MSRLTITLSEARYRALKEASAQRMNQRRFMLPPASVAA